MARKIDPATADRLRALAAERTPAVVQAELDAQEAAYQAEADWRKAESMRRIPALVEARRRLGTSK